MHIRTQSELPKLSIVMVVGFLLVGISAQNVWARQSEQPPKSDSDSQSEKTEKTKSAPTTKPLTTRPDPRKQAVADKTEPKTDRELALERKARDAARKRGEITFDDLKFDIEKDGEFKPEMITPDLKAMDKKSFTLRGFMLPASVFQQSGIKKFVLVRDDRECCFGPGAALYDCVMVEMAPGKSANYSIRIVAVKGKFEIDTESFKDPDRGHEAVYKITAEEVK